MRMTRLCNYCNCEADVVLQWTDRKSPRHKPVTITIAACAEHEQSVNYRSNRELHPGAETRLRDVA